MNIIVAAQYYWYQFKSKKKNYTWSMQLNILAKCWLWFKTKVWKKCNIFFSEIRFGLEILRDGNLTSLKLGR